MNRNLGSASEPPWNLGADQLHWDPVPHIPLLEGRQYLGPRPISSADAIFCGKWEERNWRNVPGPIYGAMTDNCRVGRASAPRHVLYGDDDNYEQEFLYRQPRSLRELLEVLDGAWQDPWGGWACDGDEHWTYAAVREWWRERTRVEEWIQCKIVEWGDRRADHIDAVVGLRDYAEYLGCDVESHLRAYSFWLEERRVPVPADTLPAL